MKEKIEKIKQDYLKAKSQAEADEHLAKLLKLADEDAETFGELYLEISKIEVERLKLVNIKARLEEIESMISLSYIAEKYFHKSKSWLSQRINEHVVNGKPAQFSPEELKKLNFAINDIGQKLGAFTL